MSPFMLILLFILPMPWVARLIWPHKITFPEMGITTAVSLALAAVVYMSGTIGLSSDHEIWNGEITKKSRVHGHYIYYYPCNCRLVCSGSGSSESCSTSCDTCSEDRYTVKWTAHSTIGDFTVDSLDRASKRVYLTPDGARYLSINAGDACSRMMPFTNYIKAVPESLFNSAYATRFEGRLPSYPDKIYDLYRIDRVLAVGMQLPEQSAWNQSLSLALRKLGPQKQANAIIVFVKGADTGYLQALESHWLGGKKNDIIIVIGTDRYPVIDWVGVSSWSKSELFKVKLRDDIKALGSVDRAKVMDLLIRNTNENFKRRDMKDFDYLKDEIEPPLWIVMLAFILGVGSSIGLGWFFYRNEL